MKEWDVRCDWCNAKANEPCKTEDGTLLDGVIHRPRAKLYDEVHGLNYLDRKDIRGRCKQ